MNADASLAWLLRPMTVDAFIAEVWGRKAGIVRKGRPGDFASLFSVSAMETFLEYVRPDQDAVRLVRSDRPKPPEDFRLSNGGADMVRLRNHLATATPSCSTAWTGMFPAIATLAHAIEAELNFEIQVNAYITPPKSQGIPRPL